MSLMTAWDTDFTAVLMARLRLQFVRVETRQHAVAYLRRSLGWNERKNGWQLTEATGDMMPDGPLVHAG